MHIEIHDSPEQMVEALQRNAEHTKAGLHPAQAALTFGSHWVQFIDIPTRHIIFGRVETPEQIAFDELCGPGGYPDPNAEWNEVMATVTEVEVRQSNGLLYSMAFDRFDPTGSPTEVHKAHVWPIEERLFNMAMDVEFEIANLGEVGRVLLDIAFRSMRAHTLPETWGKQA